MRLTSELIEHSSAFLNPLGEYELDLRSNHIPLIENLASTLDRYDCIDLSNNELQILDNFPSFPRLRTLLLHNNRELSELKLDAKKLCSLEHIWLNGCIKLVNLDAIKCLRGFRRLRCLSLMDCGMTRMIPHYRLRLIRMLPQLRILDCRKIKKMERESSKKMFPRLNDVFKIDENIIDSLDDKRKRTAPGTTVEDEERIKDALKKAKTLEEIHHLERILATGHIPD